MNPKRLLCMKRSAVKEKHNQPQKQQTLEAEAPQGEMELPFQANIMQLQTVAGNWEVQRLLAEGQIHRQTGLLQRNPIPEAPAPTAAPEVPAAGEQRPAAEAPPQGEPGEIIFEEGMYVGNAEFHTKALPKNQYYAEHPPKPGWPYTPELTALWEQGNYNEFADQVATIQHFRMKLLDDQVDGILGRVTAKELLKSHMPEASAPSSSAESAAASAATPGKATLETPATTPTKPEADDPALKGHPAASRILTPVQQAFGEYKQAEKEYNEANGELEKAKKAEKASKEPERQKTLTTMEEKRALARAAMAAARREVAGLQASEFAGDEAKLKRVKAFINWELNANTVYYAQGFNANILSGKDGKAAAGRTCNMTVISMMVEALGKSTKDYQGGNLSAIAAEYGEQLGVNNARPEDLASLRMPDFLQLVAIDVAGGREKAAGRITAHSFIIQVAQRFGLRLTQVEGGQVQERKADPNKKDKEDPKSFLGTKYASKLDTIGALYRPAYNDAAKAVKQDETYKSLKGKEREAYKQKFIQDFTEKQRQTYLSNVTKWIEIDTFSQEKLNASQAELNAPNPADPTKPKSFAEVQAKLNETISALKEYESSIPKEFKGKSKDFKMIITEIEKARNKGISKPDAAPKDLKKLFDGKGKDDLLKKMEDNLAKYEKLKTIYEKLATPEGIEEVVPVDDYKASIIPTMQIAINSGNQVMVNLENHFVRLQSVNEEGIIIDDPGTRWGENTKITWEQARQFGYFKHYLMLSP